MEAPNSEMQGHRAASPHRLLGHLGRSVTSSPRASTERSNPLRPLKPHHSSPLEARTQLARGQKSHTVTASCYTRHPPPRGSPMPVAVGATRPVHLGGWLAEKLHPGRRPHRRAKAADRCGALGYKGRPHVSSSLRILDPGSCVLVGRQPSAAYNVFTRPSTLAAILQVSPRGGPGLLVTPTCPKTVG